jgi:hypothetical protein
LESSYIPLSPAGRTQNNVIECANRGEMAHQQMLLGRNLSKIRDDFIALVKNDGVSFCATVIDQFEFHGSTPFSALPRVKSASPGGLRNLLAATESIGNDQSFRRGVAHPRKQHALACHD